MATKQRNVEKPIQMESLIGVTCINRLPCRWKKEGKKERKEKTCANLFLALRHSRGKFNFSIFQLPETQFHQNIFVYYRPTKMRFPRTFIDLCMTSRIWYASMDLSLHAARA